ncbi:hypothetical protein CYMTET_32316 [Cymbomonas tetramitiformis]|uniref:ABC1 atypical kinase-like domain-containing protein n=1 Tax=Cymbomonas tetramitiformis TaxID=36881 RepID=A0AAE0FF15_9CHLO|nr:hypothetical protein CYMTET_32316 [Cymbomonas tetramitiformis]
MKRKTDVEVSDKFHPLKQIPRAAAFWKRVTGIYIGYKATQVHVRLKKLLGASPEETKARWDLQHRAAGKKMYELCVDLEGFYIKAGQFLGSRPDFVPLQICKQLVSLQDQVPPMMADKVQRIITEELAPKTFEDVFEYIDLAHPLGSASIAQVHKARLRSDWKISSNDQQPGKRKNTSRIVAVKVQYPNAEGRMMADIDNLRILSGFLQKSELKFDLVSACDELSAQLRLEFDFKNEARVMDCIADNLKCIRGKLTVPRSIPGLVTRRLLVMDYLDGIQGNSRRMMAEVSRGGYGRRATAEVSRGGMGGAVAEVNRLAEVTHLSSRARSAAGHKVIKQLSAAYGHMLLDKGLFQVTCSLE